MNIKPEPTMITIYFNQKKLSLIHDITLVDVLSSQGFLKGCFAITLNQVFIPRPYYPTTFLKEADIIDIISPMQGG
jgi:thiamine biosynthesis protein ThiS